MSDGTLSAPLEHVMWFVDNALDQMAAIVRDLGDELANRRLDSRAPTRPTPSSATASASWSSGVA